MTSPWRYPFALLGIVFILIGYAFWPRHRTIPVLIYHDVATSTHPADGYTVESTLLSKELAYLKENGYTPLSFAVAQTLAASSHLPEHPIILTFDDALPGQSENVLPQLIAQGIPATFFITSDLVGDSAHMNWQDVLAIASAGMEIGGHSKTHAHLQTESDAALVNEIAGDKTNIEHEIGHPITVFAYPFEEHDTRTDAAVQNAGYTIVRDDDARFRSTVLTNSFDAFLKAI